VRALLRGIGAAIVVAIAIVLVGVGWFANAIYRDTSFPAAPVDVVVPRGATFDQVAALLARNGVVGNALAFRILAKLRHVDGDVRAGEYRFPKHQTQSDVLRALLTGGAQVAIWVTFPEGFTAKQIAQRLQDAGIGRADRFERAFKHDTLVVDGARTKSMEGFLFPSTYLIPSDAGPADVERIMTGAFLTNLPRDAAARAKALHVTVPQAVTIASLIEAEAKVDEERPIMASVYYNRLRLHMPLQVDATIEYALPEHKTELSFADLRIDSAYNSYTHVGLPPTPIGNPGRPSLQAAFHPAKTGYLYYVYKGGGHHAFANTLAEHNANVAKYEK
jgi:UPF0755 protein